jgi:putative FmdB family regulatory protein
MPVYEYRCNGKCGKKFDRFLKLADYLEPQSCCGLIAQKVVSKPAVFGDLPGYESPATGKWVEGRHARNEDLKRSGCVPFEAGMREDNRRKREADQQKDEQRLEAAIEQVAGELSN